MTLYLGRDSIWDMFERSIWLPYIKAHMVKFLTGLLIAMGCVHSVIVGT